MNSEYKKSRWRKFRISILKRDRYICQYFKRYGKTEEANMVHHIFPTETNPELFYNPFNLISLSYKAHELMHDRVTGELTMLGKKLQDKYKDKILEWQERNKL